MKPLTPQEQKRLRFLLGSGGAALLAILVMFGVGSVLSRHSRAAHEAELAASAVLHGKHVSLRPTVPPPVPMPTPVVAPETAQEVALMTRAQSAGAAWAARVLAKDAMPLPSGPGIVVAEPVVTSAQSYMAQGLGRTDLTAFGAGCGRWLHLVVGGWGALGKTPTWGLVDDRRRALKRSDLRLRAADVSRFSQGLGLTHLALGTLSGTSQQMTLAYQIWTANPSQKVGAPLNISGTRDQIVAQLPSLAHRIGSALGAGSMPTPRLATGSVGELSLLGDVPWKADASIPDTRLWAARERDRKALSEFAPRLPLAAVLLLNGGVLNGYEPIYKTLSTKLPQTAPDNVLTTFVLAQEETPVAWNSAPFRAAWTRLMGRYHRNFALSAAASSLSAARLVSSSPSRAALHMIACAPDNSLGWQRLSDALMDEAETTRQSRGYGEMNRAERAKVDKLYPLSLRSALKAASLDPENAQVWRSVSGAAAFDSDRHLGDLAFWRAWRLSPTDTDVLFWGLEMFQPKWHNEPDSLCKVAASVESNSLVLSAQGQHAMDSLVYAGLSGEGVSLLGRTLRLFEFRAKRNPTDADAHYNLAKFYEKNGRTKVGDMQDDAIQQYKLYLALRPGDAQSHYDLANLLYTDKHVPDPKSTVQAEMHLRQALALNPRMPDALSELGDITYEVHHNAKAAEPLYRQAIALKDDCPAHIGLAALLLNQGKRAEALAQAQHAIALGYANQEDVYGRLGLNSQSKPTPTKVPFRA